MGLDLLILNLTRFGDLIQTQPLIMTARKAGLRCGLIALSNFAAAMPLLQGLDASWSFSGADISRHLASNNGKNWALALNETLEFVRNIRKEAQPKYIVNLTATLSSRLLSRLLSLGDSGFGDSSVVTNTSDKAKIKISPATNLGFAVDADGFGLNCDPWTAYLEGTIARRNNAPFHLADMFKSIINPCLGSAKDLALIYAEQVKEWQESKNLAILKRPESNFGREFLKQANSEKVEIAGFIGLQLGASATRRQWPIANFCELGQRLWQKCRLYPVLLGTKSEENLANEYLANAKHPCLNAIGKTSLAELASLVSQLKLLVSNDTGTLHLAAGLGIPCFGIYLATAQVCDTGPYLANCCCVEPALTCHPCEFGSNCENLCNNEELCRQQIPARLVAPLIEQWFQNGSWDNVSKELAKVARVWLTSYAEDGFVAIKSLSGHGEDARTLWLEWQRIWWRQTLEQLQAVQVQANNANITNYLASNLAVNVADQADRARLKELGLQLGAKIFLQEERAFLIKAIAAARELPALSILLRRKASAGQLFLRQAQTVQAALDACRQNPVLAHFWKDLCNAKADNLEIWLAKINIFVKNLEIFLDMSQ